MLFAGNYTQAKTTPPNAMSAASKVWFPAKYQHLYRHSSGTYYGRLCVAGKKTWRSLKTRVLSVAKPKLDDLLQDAASQEASTSEAGGSCISRHETRRHFDRSCGDSSTIDEWF